MITKVQRWGNRLGLRLHKSLLAAADIAVGDEVTVVTEVARSDSFGREVW